MNIWELILGFLIGFATQKGQAQGLAHSILFYIFMHKKKLCRKPNKNLLP